MSGICTVVTGASSGIGAAVAARLLARGESVVAVLEPLQKRCAELTKEKEYIDGIIKANAEKAAYFASKTLRKVHRKLGFPDRIR